MKDTRKMLLAGLIVGTENALSAEKQLELLDRVHIHHPVVGSIFVVVCVGRAIHIVVLEHNVGKELVALANEVIQRTTQKVR